MSDEAVKLARAIETAQCVCDSEEYDSDDLLRLRDVTPMLLEEMAKLRADNDVLRTQVEYRAEPLGLDDWARRLLDKYTGYPHVNTDPFDSLDMGQRQALIWEYASELLVRGKRIEVLRAALTEALDMLGEFEHFNDARIAELRLLL